MSSNVTLGTPADDPEVPHRVSPPPTVTPSAPAPAPAPAPPAVPLAPAGPIRPLGDPVALSAEPCKSKGLHVRAVVPTPEDLDLSYRGVVPGIEIRRTVRAGSGGFRHVTLADGVVEADIWARGTGVVAGAVGLESCTGGSAADVSFEILAHYRH